MRCWSGGTVGAFIAALTLGGCALVTSFDVEDGTEGAAGEAGGVTGPPCSVATDCPSDGVFCNGAESCQVGRCVSAGDPCDGADGDDDCSEQCDESTDSCDGQDEDGTACDDGSFCNGSDSCQAGSCAAHAGDPCRGFDGDANCRESCDENADACIAADANGSACDDGLYCNGQDSCLGGACVATGFPPCEGPGDSDSDCWETCREDYDDCNGMDENGSSCVYDSEPACCLNGGCSPLAC